MADFSPRVPAGAVEAELFSDGVSRADMLERLAAQARQQAMVAANSFAEFNSGTLSRSRQQQLLRDAGKQHVLGAVTSSAAKMLLGLARQRQAGDPLLVGGQLDDLTECEEMNAWAKIGDGASTPGPVGGEELDEEEPRDPASLTLEELMQLEEEERVDAELLAKDKPDARPTAEDTSSSKLTTEQKRRRKRCVPQIVCLPAPSPLTLTHALCCTLQSQATSLALSTCRCPVCGPVAPTLPTSRAVQSWMSTRPEQ